MFDTQTQRYTLKAAALRARWPALAARCNGRIESAVALAATPAAIRLNDLGYQVERETVERASWRAPQPYTCTCPDYRQHAPEGIVCAHILAVWMTVGSDPEMSRLADSADKAAAQVAADHKALIGLEVAWQYNSLATARAEIAAITDEEAELRCPCAWPWGWDPERLRVPLSFAQQHLVNSYPLLV